jgi:hypothetical protein
MVQKVNLQNRNGVVGRAEFGFCSSLFWISVFCNILSTPFFTLASVSSSGSSSISTKADPRFGKSLKAQNYLELIIPKYEVSLFISWII